jgi:hypothetical protein
MHADSHNGGFGMSVIGAKAEVAQAGGDFRF